MNTFHIVDYILFSLMIIISLGIGIYSACSGGKQKTTAEYLMGNRQLSLGPVALSICVSMISSNTLVGVPAEIYGFGITYGLIGSLGLLSGFILAYTVVEVIYPLGIVSIHQYLEMRFESATLKWYGAVIQILLQILYVGTVLFGPATCLEVSTGIPTWISLIAVAVIGILYTTLGGMKAVVWTDTFQCMIMIAGNIALVIIGCIKVGGVSNVIDLNNKWGRFDVSLSLDPTVRLTVWSATFGGLFFVMSLVGPNQPCMQRTCTVQTISQAKWSAIIGCFFMCFFTTLSSIVGLVIFACYSAIGCDPVQSGMISSGNQILPYYIMDVLAYPGLPGVLFSSLFSGSLSSLSSSINSMSAVMWEDILQPHFKHWSEQKKTLCNKILTVIFGLCCLASSFMMLYVGGSLVAIAASVLGAVLGPLLGVFFLAVLVPFCNWKGAFIGGIISAVVNLWLLFGSVLTESQVTRLPAPTFGCVVDELNTSLRFSDNFTDIQQTVIPLYVWTSDNTTLSNVSLEPDAEGFLEWLYSVSYMLYSIIGVFLSMSIGILISLCTGYTKMKDVDPQLVASYVYCYNGVSKEAKYQVVEIREGKKDYLSSL